MRGRHQMVYFVSLVSEVGREQSPITSLCLSGTLRRLHWQMALNNAFNTEQNGHSKEGLRRKETISVLEQNID
ncbi:hypothetical protein ES702_01584 [subsurface metagenome]